MDDQNKNLILATALSFIVILTWFVLFPPPEPDVITEPPATVSVPDAAGQLETPSASSPAATAPETTEQALATAERIDVLTPKLSGSISLQGGRIDDLVLLTYNETIDPDSPPVRLLSPRQTATAYLAVHGWLPQVGVGAEDVPNPNTLWEIETGDDLTPQTPVTLIWENGNGLTFRKEIAVDENYMFNITQTVENNSGTEISLQPYGYIAQYQDPDTIGFFILHEGAVRVSDGKYEEIDYDDMADLSGEDEKINVTDNGWIAFTDQYWMTALVPEPGTAFEAVTQGGPNFYQISTLFDPVVVTDGALATSQSQVYAGAQEWEAIRDYQNDQGIERFVDVIDWGWFYFLTKPIFAVLHWINGLIGNMGWAIIGLTLIIKAVLLPLAYKSYVSMAKMRELQPQMEKLKESAGDDREKLQKGMMELYKTNKVNPASGCLPILLQIPIFFSLYKVIFVTIELRHAPWIGWVKDLSAPDTSSLFNLFGILPWDAPAPDSILSLIFIGILPICLGISMWLQQKLNPPVTDPTQRMIFAWMPWVFMFMLGSFASGLVLYWIANNTITFAQQYAIMRSQGFKPDLFGNITGRSKAEKK